ncbi:MAG: MerR family transcriptional regulator [Myxococcota bacterium]
MKHRNLMPIGRFSNSCRLSIKALRYYADIGLLTPAHVDASSGYRYYDAKQARPAVLIGMLRGLGVPVERVRMMLDADPATLNQLLNAERERLAAELKQKKQALESIERLALHGDLVPYERIEVRREPPHTVATREGSSRAENLVEDGAQLIGEVLGELQQYSRGYEDPVMCINGDPDRSGRITIQACIGVAWPPPELSHATIMTLPAVNVAWLLHRGSYDTLGLAYHALDAWSQGLGHTRAGPMREIYLNDPSTVSPEDLLTEVLLPLE